jgi:hypothetical protein
MFGAKPREYKIENIEVKKENLASWQKAAVGNPDLALALAKKIKDMDNPDLALLEAGVGFALQAADIGTTVLGKIGTLVDVVTSSGEGEGDPTEAFTKLFGEIRDDFNKSSKGTEAADLLVKLLADKIDDDYNFTDGYKPSEGDAVQAVIVLTLALVGNADLNDLQGSLNGLIDFDENDGPKVSASAGEKANQAKVLVAFLNSTEFFKDVL